MHWQNEHSTVHGASVNSAARGVPLVAACLLARPLAVHGAAVVCRLLLVPLPNLVNQPISSCAAHSALCFVPPAPTRSCASEWCCRRSPAVLPPPPPHFVRALAAPHLASLLLLLSAAAC